MESFVNIVKAQIAYRLIVLTSLEKRCQTKWTYCKDKVELELIVVVTNLDKYDEIYPIKVVLRKKLLIDMYCNCTRFF